MDPVFKPEKIEPEAQKFWETNQTFEVVEDSGKEKFYCLCMFPYPSGHLHMGHVRNLHDRRRHRALPAHAGQERSAADGLGCLRHAGRERGDQARCPAGAMDLPKHRLHARASSSVLGFGYDWRREVATCKPDTTAGNSGCLRGSMRKGLVYRKNAVVNWDPVDQTVLANEQVIDGRGWRSDALVERREIPQWFMKITAYADELLADLDKLPGWPDAGRSDAAQLDRALRGHRDQFDVEAQTSR